MVTLEESYARCRTLNKKFGSTYFWSTHLLPAPKRHHVHALYAFCRYADDIVDVDTDRTRRERLTEFGERFFVDLERGSSQDPILMAVVDTALRLNIDPECFHRFMRSMQMDFEVSTYADFDALMTYMDGSAAVIGEMMLPVLEPKTTDAFEPARALGVAFQLTNFLRDIGEDLDRRRVYIPQDTLERFGADPYERRVTEAWRNAMAFEIERTRAIYATADAGADILPPASAKCVRVARKLYSGILDQIESNDYDVFAKRARVPGWRKLFAAVTAI